MFGKKIPTMRLTLRVLAHLLRYPDERLREHLQDLREALRAERALGRSRIAELEALILHLQTYDPMALEAHYVELFDRSRQASLLLFEHVHGDGRDRGPAMIDLAQTYEQAGLHLAPGQMPDELPVLLEFASTQPPAQAREFLGETAHIVRAIFSAVLRKGSPYASVLAAVLELAGEKVEKVKSIAAVEWNELVQPTPLQPEPSLDESWAEPAAFGGCSFEGQARPSTPQPVHIVRTARHSGVQP